MISDRGELPIDVPFSLSCCECDCDSPNTLEEALAAGWTDIQYTPDGLAENFLGYCPEHSRLLDMTPSQIAAERRRREGSDGLSDCCRSFS